MSRGIHIPGGDANATHLKGYADHTRTAGAVTVASPSLIAFEPTTDLVLPADVGDILHFSVNCQMADNVAGVLEWNILFVDGSGVELSRVGGAGNGTIPSWSMRPGEYWPMSGNIQYTVAAGDTDGGVLTARLYAFTANGISRSVHATAAYPFKWSVSNYGAAS